MVSPNIIKNYKKHFWSSERTIVAANDNNFIDIDCQIQNKIANLNNSTRLAVNKLMNNVIEDIILK